MFLISLIRLTAIICLHRSHIISKPCSSYHFATKAKSHFSYRAFIKLKLFSSFCTLIKLELSSPHCTSTKREIKHNISNKKSQGSARKRAFLGFITTAYRYLIHSDKQLIEKRRKSRYLPWLNHFLSPCEESSIF